MPPKTRSGNDTLEFISREEVKDLMNLQRETILACFRETVSTFLSTVNERVDRLPNDVQDIKTSLNFTGDVAENKLIEVNEKIEKLKIEMKSTQSTQGEIFNVTSTIKRKLADLEDRSRRCNLRVDGINEHQNENWELTKSKIKNFIKEDLEIQENVEIERAHRVTTSDSKRNNRPRTIVFKLLRYPDKEKILAKRKLLQGTNYYINEDFSEETNRIRKELQLEAKQHRAEGKFARVVYNRLVVHNRRDELNEENTQGNDQHEG